MSKQKTTITMTEASAQELFLLLWMTLLAMNRQRAVLRLAQPYLPAHLWRASERACNEAEFVLLGLQTIGTDEKWR